MNGVLTSRMDNPYLMIGCIDFMIFVRMGRYCLINEIVDVA